MIFTAVKSYKIVQCHGKMPMTTDSIRGYGDNDADTTMRNKSNASRGRHNTLILMISVVTFLLAFGSRATNAEPTAPAQVAAAVAAATGTNEKLAGQPVTVETSPSSAADCVNHPHATAFSPAPQLPQEVEAISTDYSTGSQTSMTGPQPQLQAEEDGGNSNSYHKFQQQNSGNTFQQDEEQRQQQLLLAPLLMPSASMSAEWPSQQQSTSVDGLSVIPSLSSVVGRERTVMEIVPVPSASEQHLVGSSLLQPSQLEYNYLPTGNQQSELELQQPDPEPQQPKQSEPSEQMQIPSQQQQQTNVPSDQQQYSYYYGNNNNAVINHNNDDDQQQQYSYHYYHQQNLAQQQQQQRQLNINNNNNNNNNNNAPAAYSPSPLQYGGGQYHYYNNFGAVGKYPPQQQQQSHHYRGRDGGRPLARRNSRSQQQAAYDNNNGNFHHYAPPQLHPQPSQKPSPDYGGESDNVIGIKYDQDQTVGGAAGKHQQVPPFRPSHPVWASQYPVPWTYYVKSSMVQPGRPAMPYAQHNNNNFHGRKSRYVLQQPGGAASNRVGGGGYSAAKPPRTKVVYIEYGGFKPKMVPSVQITAAEGYDAHGANANRRQSTVDNGADGTDGGDAAAQQDGAGHREYTPAATPVAVNATTATTASTTTTTSTTTTSATAATNATTASTGTASPPSPTPPSPSPQPQKTEPEQQPPAGGVVVVVV